MPGINISPVTPLGKFTASIMMFIGYGIIAVPTGIVTTKRRLLYAVKKKSMKPAPAAQEKGMIKMLYFVSIALLCYEEILHRMTCLLFRFAYLFCIGCWLFLCVIQCRLKFKMTEHSKMIRTIMLKLFHTDQSKMW